MADLRAEAQDMDAKTRERLIEALQADWREADLAGVDRALCAYAEKLTREPWKMTRNDVEELRAAGLGDAAIHDAVQVISYFNYINRMADAVHVDLEEGMPAYPE